jgi:hypothetical protein
LVEICLEHCSCALDGRAIGDVEVAVVKNMIRSFLLVEVHRNRDCNIPVVCQAHHCFLDLISD